MKKSRFSESQIVAILKQQESRQRVAQIAREQAISEATFYTWKSKYGGLQVSELTAGRPRRLKELEEEDRRLKQIYADLSLENQVVPGGAAQACR